MPENWRFVIVIYDIVFLRTIKLHLKYFKKTWKYIKN